jgi:VWFA-related protein
MVLVNIETGAANRKQQRHKRCRYSAANWFAAVLAMACLSISVPTIAGQSSPSTTPSTQQEPQSIPDAPSTVQPPADKPEPPPSPVPKPEERKPVERDPWTNQPINKPAAPLTDTGSGDQTSPPPPMPPVKTVPPGTPAKPNPQDQLLTFTVHPTFVQVPVTVKTKDGRPVDGLLSTDFKVLENGVEQKLSYFTADPMALSVAVVIDTGMSDAYVQKVNRTFSSLVAAFAPYDEVAVFTYSSTVSEVSDFAGATKKLNAVLNQMKTERGNYDGPPVLGGPLAGGPIINGVPVGSPTEPVYTPSKESYVLNDAILQAALALGKRDRARRKIIFVISDGRESGSKASFNDVKRVLLSNEIQVRAVAVGNTALPVYGKLERLHIPDQGHGDLLPKYASATGGMPVYTELSANAIEEVYAKAMSESRNQYLLGYTPARSKVPTASNYRSIDVRVLRPGLKVYAKDGYFAAPPVR